MSHEQAHDGSNIKRIWMVFALLSVVTTVEVYLGITRPSFLFMASKFSMTSLGKNQIRRRIFPAATSRTPRKLFCGLPRTRKANTPSIIRRCARSRANR